MTPRRALPITALALLAACGGSPVATSSAVRLHESGGMVQMVDTLTAAEVARDPIAIDSVRADGTTLRVSVSHAGGCADHTYALVGERPARATPAARVLVAHEAASDSCEALVARHLDYDLTPLIFAHRQRGWRGDTLTVQFEGSAWRVQVAP